MADPLSIASGVAGLITLAELVYFGTCRYIRTVKDAKEEARTLSDGLRDLLNVLCQLRLWAARMEAEDGLQPSESSCCLPVIDSCHRVLLRLSSRLEKLDPNKSSESFLRQLKWPFSSSEMRKLMENLEHLKSTITLALSSKNTMAIVDILSKQEKVAKDVKLIKEELKDGLARQRALEEKLDSLASKKDRQTILDFFGKISPAQRHQTSQTLRYPNTGMWLLEADEFKEWLSGIRRALWLSGIAGGGKTVLASAVIEAAQSQCQDFRKGCAYFYCDYKDESTQELVNILGSLLAQLASQNVEAFLLLQEYYQTCQSNGPLAKPPEAMALVETLERMNACFEGTYIIVDGLDECNKNTGDVTRALASMALATGLAKGEVLITLLSRDEEDIRPILANGFTHIEIAARSGDLQLYVTGEMDRRIRTGELEINNSKLKDTIQKRLVEEAEGMFRWVACQLDYMCELPTDKDRRIALDNLPPSLEETYVRILRRVHAQNPMIRQIVQKTLRWIMCAMGRMTTNCLLEALCIEAGHRSLEPDGKPSLKTIRKYCSSLVRMSFDHQCLELAHFTVEEFLRTSDSVRFDVNSKEFDLAQYLIDPLEADRQLATTCLVYLNLDDFDLPLCHSCKELEDLYEKYPFRQYASLHWFDHARSFWEEGLVLEEAEVLFRPSKSRKFDLWALDFMIWVWEPEEKYFINAASAASSYGATPLHFACLIGAAPLVENLLAQGCNPNQVSRLGYPLQCSLLGWENIWMYKDRSPDPDFDVSKLFSIEATESTGLIHLTDQMLVTMKSLLDAGADSSIPLVNGGPNRRSLLSMLGHFTGRVDLIRGAVSNLLRHGAKLGEDFPDDVQSLCGMPAELDHVRALLDCVRSENVDEGLRTRFLQLAAIGGSIAPQSWLKDSAQLGGLERKSNDPRTVLAALESAIRHSNQEELREIMLANSVDANIELPGEHLPALHLAAKYRSLGSVVVLLRSGCNVNQQDVCGQTALHHSASSNDTKILDILLERGADLNISDHEGRTVCHVAACSNSVDYLKALLTLPGFDRSALFLRSRAGRTPLREAAENASEGTLIVLAHAIGDLSEHSHSLEFHLAKHIVAMDSDVLELFIARNMDLALPSRAEGSLLHFYVNNGASLSPQNIQVLIQHGCSPDTVDSNGRTPLHGLMRRQNLSSLVSPDLLKMLATPQNIERQDADGRTVLQYFLCNKDVVSKTVSMLRTFLEYGASLQACSNSEQSLIEILDTLTESSIDSYLYDTGELIINLEQFSIEILSQVPIPTYRPNIDSALRNVFLWASSLGMFRIVDLLLDQKGVVNPEALNALLTSPRWSARFLPGLFKRLPRAVLSELDSVSGQNTLHVLCHSSLHDFGSFEALIATKPELNVLSIREAYTALIFAVLASKPQHVKLLLHHGADHSFPVIFDRLHLTHYKDSYEYSSTLDDGEGENIDSFGSNWIDSFPDSACLESDLRLSQTTSFDPDRWDTRGGLVRNGNLLHCAALDVEMIELVLRRCPGIDVNHTDCRGVSPLDLAALFGKVKAIESLASHGAHLDHLGSNGASVMHRAAATDLRVVKYLLDRGIGINEPDSNGWLPIHFAAAKGKLDIARLLLQKGTNLPATFKGHTAQIIAIASNHWEIAVAIQRTIDAPSDVGLASSSSHIRLKSLAYLIKSLKTAIHEDELSNIETLLDFDIRIAESCGFCCGPALLALEKFRTEALKILRSHKILPEGTTCDSSAFPGFTPVHLAARRSSMLDDLMSILSSSVGLDYHLTQGVHPLHVAVAKENHKGLEQLIQHYVQLARSFPLHNSDSIGLNNSDHPSESTSIISLLDRPVSFPPYGAPFISSRRSTSQDLGATPLHIAAVQNDETSVNILIRHGATLDSRDIRLNTPLHWAAFNGYFSMVRLLLKHGANSKSRNCQYETPALLAARAGFFALAQELEQGNLGISDSDICGLTYLAHALRQPSGLVHFAQSQPTILSQDNIDTNQLTRAWKYTKPVASPEVSERPLIFMKALRYAAKDYNTTYPPSVPQSALAIAAMTGNARVLKLLVETEGVPEININEPSGKDDVENVFISACRGGRLEILKFMIRYILSRPGLPFNQTLPGIWHASRHFPEIHSWLLVERYTEQKRLCDSPSLNSGLDAIPFRLWSGLERKEVPLTGPYWRFCHETMLEYATRLRSMHDQLKGKVLCWAPGKEHPFVVGE